MGKSEQLKIGVDKSWPSFKNLIVTFEISNIVPWKTSIEVSKCDEPKIKIELAILTAFPSSWFGMKVIPLFIDWHPENLLKND